MLGVESGPFPAETAAEEAALLVKFRAMALKTRNGKAILLRIEKNGYEVCLA